MRAAPAPPRKVFVTHGEPDPSDALRLRIQRELGWEACIPELFQPLDLPPRTGG